ncbi:MAG: antitoxin VapB family protein [Candidatus Desulfofervidus auxilii]|nr:antitoxin VapB family protein [Candidatus Desulfofervidus auxilii]
MKTITIREEVYEKLVKLKREGESFSDVIERLLNRPRISVRFFAGRLKDSEALKYLEETWLEFRRRVKLR